MSSSDGKELKSSGLSTEIVVSNTSTDAVTFAASKRSSRNGGTGATSTSTDSTTRIGKTNPSELLAAMRHGEANPRAVRSPSDLGRFGLGLKTASFSQCRSLTVISVKEGVYSGAEWNLDAIEKADDWILNVLDDEDMNVIPYFDRLDYTHGEPQKKA